MSNPYAFIGLPIGNQTSGSTNTSAMSLGHNIAIGNLPFPTLLSQNAGQGIPGLPFPIQPALGLSMGTMIPGKMSVGINQTHNNIQPHSSQSDVEASVSRAKESEKSRSCSRNKERLRYERRDKDSRKRGRSESNAESDDDIMVLSNSPSSNETSERREHQPKQWDNPPVMGIVANGGLGFTMPNPALVGGTVFPNDAASIMAAMGSQIPFDFGLMSGVMNNITNQTKEAIHLKSCILFPPNPQAPPPTTRERPPGCRTVFVGGLPENMSEESLKEIFERCGEITTIRMSKKNFAHVRFEREGYVDNAISLSGYRIRLNHQKAEGGNNGSGRLHVDFAQARDDQYEYECQQRRLEREQRHRQRIEEEKWRPPSPPPVPHYAEHEAHGVVEQLKSEERFTRAVQVLATWLERGDCSKRNANGFYSMIQSAHAHLRRLGTEKGLLEEEAKRTHDTLKQKFLNLTTQLGEMERLFQAASHQKAWDHFTKAQRKNLEAWKKHVLDLKSVPTIDFLTGSCKGDDNMELSDSDTEDPRRYRADANEKSIASLKEENDSLRCQLEAYKNEVDLVRTDLKSELAAKEEQIKILQDNMKSLQQKLISEHEQVAETNMHQSEIQKPQLKLISLLSVYLSIHPRGATVDSLMEFVEQNLSSVVKEDMESTLAFNTDLFQLKTDRWLFKPFISQ